MGWKDRMEELPIEQRHLLQGGSLSQRFSRHPLGLTHPALIGGFYGLLVSISLLLPLGEARNWDNLWLKDWGFIAVTIMLLNAITGHISLVVSKIIRRPPVSLPRKIIYPMPFLGLILFTCLLMTDVENGLSETLQDYSHHLSWFLIIIPGPIYVHMSWAPRWRLLCRLEDGLDPFDGATPIPPRADIESDESDTDFTSAIENLEDDPPLLYHDSEE
ncbi:MAG: hypothetical protein QGF94_04275 [Candidatus Thalassarchaeaceae archaeon]|jgi:hypothetical protein|nr:hypothetical protein [Candidatus Thalassarchaeaceae archaeon]